MIRIFLETKKIDKLTNMIKIDLSYVQWTPAME